MCQYFLVDKIQHKCRYCISVLSLNNIANKISWSHVSVRLNRSPLFSYKHVSFYIFCFYAVTLALWQHLKNMLTLFLTGKRDDWMWFQLEFNHSVSQEGRDVSHLGTRLWSILYEKVKFNKLECKQRDRGQTETQRQTDRWVINWFWMVKQWNEM